MNLKFFQNSEFGELGVMMIDGKEYFPAVQCARILGYSNPRKAIIDHCDSEGVTKCYSLTDGGNQEMKFITEGNLYRLIVRSRLSAAKKFERWVFDEVLPEIRLTGSYGGINIEEVITKAVTTAVSETIKSLIPLLTVPQAAEKRIAVICKPKVRYKIDLLPANVRKQVDDLKPEAVHKITVALLELEQSTADFITELNVSAEGAKVCREGFIHANKTTVKHLEKLQLQGLNFDELITALKLENDTLKKELTFN
ncbi:MAG: hypothetical protein NC093_11080 [Alistipes sp.]|nr:hypothetical protein [Alistipes sp.]